jgi:hypothetical protein
LYARHNMEESAWQRIPPVTALEDASLWQDFEHLCKNKRHALETRQRKQQVVLHRRDYLFVTCRLVLLISESNSFG